nr:homeobox protein knotted-1-like 6 [Ipomoea batatas]
MDGMFGISEFPRRIYGDRALMSPENLMDCWLQLPRPGFPRLPPDRIPAGRDKEKNGRTYAKDSQRTPEQVFLHTILAKKTLASTMPIEFNEGSLILSESNDGGLPV